jgi:hypothetical protein
LILARPRLSRARALALLAQAGFDIVDDAPIVASQADEIAAMRAVASVAVAALDPDLSMLTPGSALVRFGKVVPEWFPAVFLGDLEPFEKRQAHGSIAVVFPISFGRVTDADMEVNTRSGKPRVDPLRRRRT